MNSTMNYMIEANAGLVFFYGIYCLLLRTETEFRKQRMFLLAGAVCALVSPLIHINLIATQPVIAPATTTLTTFLPDIVVGKSSGPVSTTDMLIWIYVLVVIAISVPILLQGLKIYRFVLSSAGSYRDNYYVIESKNDNPSWSFFRLIFIGQSNTLTSEEKDLVVRHEMLHGKLLHSVDALVFTLLCMVFWFNPIVWIYRNTMARIHEFEVDAIVAENNGSNYGLLLAKTALSANGFPLTHHFNQSFILKRINMLNMLKRRISNWKLTVLATTVVLYFVAVACTEQVSLENAVVQNGDIPSNVAEGFAKLKQAHPDRIFELKEITDKARLDKLQDIGGVIALYTSEIGKTWIITEKLDDKWVFTIVEQTAMPKGGLPSFYERLGSVLIYPEEARRLGVQGKVFVEFIVMEDGHLTDFKVVKGIGAGCDQEALRVLSQMTSWNPGTMKGKAVAQKMVLPITFRLE